MSSSSLCQPNPIHPNITKDKKVQQDVQRYDSHIIRSFICNMKRPSVKQSVKQQVSSNFQIYLGKTDDYPPPLPSPPSPFETARAQSELFAFQCSQWEPIRNSQLIGRYKEMSVWHQVNLMIYPPLPSPPLPPPFETARAQSELFTFQCSQWEPIQNSQLIGRYKEMSVWHQVNLTIYPPFETAKAQSELFTFQCSQWEPMQNSQLIGRYQEMSVWHLNL